MENLMSSEERCREVTLGFVHKTALPTRSKEVPSAEPHSSGLLDDCQIDNAGTREEQNLKKKKKEIQSSWNFKNFQTVS